MSCRPWDRNKDMQQKLEHAGWRYAQLIGIVDVVPNDIPEHEAQADKAKYSHFVKRDGRGLSIWDVIEDHNLCPRTNWLRPAHVRHLA